MQGDFLFPYWAKLEIRCKEKALGVPHMRIRPRRRMMAVFCTYINGFAPVMYNF